VTGPAESREENWLAEKSLIPAGYVRRAQPSAPLRCPLGDKSVAVVAAIVERR
jgi:hypothetical protein